MLIYKIIFSHCIFYVSVLLVCTYIQCMYAWCPWEVRSSRTEVMGGGLEESNMVPLQE